MGRVISGISLFLASIVSSSAWAVETINTSCNMVTTSVMPSGSLTDPGNATHSSVIGFDYDMRGSEPPATPAPTQIASAPEVGTVWGKAYNPNTQTLYVAAFLRRHSPISPNGLGAIYEIDVSDTSSAATIGTPTLWMDLNSTTHLGASATLFPNETDTNRGLGVPFDPSYDVWAFDKVGTQGLAGLDLSDDYSIMYVMDLTNRQLLVIDVTSKTVTARHAITDPGCANPADIRPFGVDYLAGDVYVGVTCSEETNQPGGDALDTFVMRLSGGSFSSVVTGSTKGYRWSSFWENDPSVGGCTATNRGAYVPIISNMELDSNGNMIVGVTNINGFRYANQNYAPIQGCSELIAIDTSEHSTRGYVLHATPSGGDWVIASTEEEDSSGFTHRYEEGQFAHWGAGASHTYQGGMAVTDCSGQEIVIVNLMDPLTFESGGTRWMRTADAQNEAATNVGDIDLPTSSSSTLEHYEGTDGTWEKSTGLGDIEYLRSTPVTPVSPPPGPTAFSCSSDVRLATTIQINGDSQAGGSTGAAENSLITFDYAATGTLASPETAITTGQIGSVWGLGYNETSQQMYASAFLKRHSSFGPNGPGAIYQLDTSSASPTASLLIDLSANGVTVGADPRTASSGSVDDPNELPIDATDPSWDRDAFDLVGKMSLGDIDVSADGNTLWAVSLNQRELVEIDISGAPSVTASHAIPDPGCSNGEYRPWAAKVHDDKVWVGIVCSAETSQDVNDLRAYITAFDGTSFLPVFDFGLNYAKGAIGGNGTDGGAWQPWTSTYQTVATDPQFAIYPQPILSDIEFDMDGSMILGFIDRSGHQMGGANYPPGNFPTTSTLVQGQSGGDIIRVCNNAGTYELESNGACGGTSTSGVGSGQGPGGGEYYWGDMWDYNPFNATSGGFHKETSFGGLAFRAGSGEVALSSMNPLQPNANAGGVVWLNNTTGARSANEGVQLYQGNGAYYGKSSGLGDVELFCRSTATCSLNAPTVTSQCNNAGTANDPSDDTFSYTVNTTGTGVGASYSISGGDTQSGVSYNSNFTSPASFPISGSDISLTLTDVDTASCMLTPVTVTAPATCSSGITQVDVALSKTVNPTSATSGDTVTYTIVATNNGPDDATGVVVSDPLPAGVTYASDDGGVNTTEAGGTVTWNIGNLAASASVTLNISVTVD